MLKYLFPLLFKINNRPFKPYFYQLKIAEPIYYKKHKRIIITATTRAGKTLILALTSILYALKYPNSRILIIAPTYDQAKIMMNYIIQHLFDNDFLLSQIANRDLRTEVSKQKITFNNMSTIEIFSAQGEAERLMGIGGDLIIVDESALVSDEVFRTRILRMLGDNPDSILIEIGNPIHLNHFYEHWNDKNFYKIHISWQDCVREGRLTKEFVEEQKRNLTEWEFKMLYDAEFVDVGEENIFRVSWIERAKNNNFIFDKKEYICGVDVARYGKDETVITILSTDGERYKIEKIINFTKSDITTICGTLINLNKQYNFKHIVVDDVGIGAGVTDFLREQNINVYPFNAGSKPYNPQRFDNLKSETVWRLKDLFENNLIQIMENKKLILQLLAWKLKITSLGKIKIVDPDDSPDYADSLMLAIYEPKKLGIASFSIF